MNRRIASGIIWMTAILLGSGLALPDAAAAEIYKCVGRDGKTIFTSDLALCVKAQPHELTKEIQIEPASAVDPRPARTRAGRARRAGRAGAAAPDRNAGQEAMWRRKQTEARKELADVTKLRNRRAKMVKGCNRGSTWWGRDESGIKRNLPCDDLKKELADLEREHARLEAYLSHGLREECRRSGCLPGWLR